MCLTNNKHEQQCRYAWKRCPVKREIMRMTLSVYRCFVTMTHILCRFEPSDYAQCHDIVSVSMFRHNDSHCSVGFEQRDIDRNVLNIQQRSQFDYQSRAPSFRGALSQRIESYESSPVKIHTSNCTSLIVNNVPQVRDYRLPILRQYGGDIRLIRQMRPTALDGLLH